MPYNGTNLDEVTKLLIEARERVAQGWCQKRFRSKGRVCALGALGVNGQSSITVLQRRAMVRLRLTNNLHTAIGQWNDLEGQSQENVLAAFDRAIATI
jgi:hypothetical protein